MPDEDPERRQAVDAVSIMLTVGLNIATPGLWPKMGASSTLHLTETSHLNSHVRVSVASLTLVGAGQVIKGWEQGLLDMCVSEKRKLTIPHEMAYGTLRRGSIDLANPRRPRSSARHPP